ncbi:hypothetical protein [Virgibacillus halodenitrificans]|uniref:hypothetical protein n=1 Tax=Virgibacillus halodenitrificans TaxID=1482 RepID=UPI000EF440EE|nr:hypothetical protein [Virgibacillus halodenitrificans]
MSILSNQFHVNFPVKGTIHFMEYFKGKNAPIFIECLSDTYIVFYSHLALPMEYKSKKVNFLYDFVFLNEVFKMKGQLIRSNNLGEIYQYEGKFINNDYERSRLFSVLNKYSIFLYKQLKESEKTEKEPKKSIYFSKRI